MKIEDKETLLKLHLQISGENSYGYKLNGAKVEYDEITDDNHQLSDNALKEKVTGICKDAKIYRIYDEFQYDMIVKYLRKKSDIEYYNPNVNHRYYRSKKLNVLCDNEGAAPYVFVSNTNAFDKILEKVDTKMAVYLKETENMMKRFGQEETEFDFFMMTDAITPYIFKYADSIRKLGTDELDYSRIYAITIDGFVFSLYVNDDGKYIAVPKRARKDSSGEKFINGFSSARLYL